MPVIKNMDDFVSILDPYIMVAMKNTRDKIFEVVSQKVVDYYNEPVFNEPDPTEPDCYNRTENLMESLSGGNVIKSNNNYMFTVGWDNEYLTFRYPGNPRLPVTPLNKVTGLQVLNWMNSGYHGGTVAGNHNFFDEAIEEIGGEEGITLLFKENLKKAGLPIK